MNGVKKPGEGLHPSVRFLFLFLIFPGLFPRFLIGFLNAVVRPAAVFVALSFVTMLFVRHGDSKPLPAKSKLESFDAGD